MRKTLGSKAGTPTKKGTWGGSYQIDYGKYSSRVSCYTCVNCVDESKSCSKYGMFIPVLGKNTWKSCPHFLLDLDYADEENCNFVKHMKGSGFVQEEIDITSIQNKSNKDKKAKNRISGSNSKITVPEEIVENVVMICIYKEINPIALFESVTQHMKQDSFNNISFDSIITKSLKNILKNDNNYHKLSQFIYQLSKELDVSMIKIMNLDLKSKKQYCKKLFESKRYMASSTSWDGEQYNLVPKNLPPYESTNLYDDDYFMNLQKIPFYGYCLDSVEEDDSIICEDDKYIVVYNPTLYFKSDCEFDLQYAFPIYYQQEYIVQKKNEYCIQCGEKFHDSYLIQENYHEWICPKCHTKNDIYKEYSFKKLYAPQPTDFK